MPSSADDIFDAPIVEAVLWSIAGIGAICRARQAAAGGRRVFTLVAICVLVFVADKALDVYSLLHEYGRALATAIDPQHQLRGPHALYRNLALASVVIAAGVALWWWLRRERRLERAQWLCVLGITLVVALVAVRLVPNLQQGLAGLPLKLAELLAWCLVQAGVLTRARDRVAPKLRDGFVG